MDLRDSSRVDIFEIYQRYCDIRSGNAYEGERNEQDDHAQRGKSSRDALAQLLNFVELRMHMRSSIFDELAKLISKLEMMVNFSEFSRFYDFMFFMCRENGQKNITVSKAVTAWRLVLAGRFRLLNQWCDFVEENQRHNISEDTWQQVLAFSRCVHENLEGYDPEGLKVTPGLKRKLPSLRNEEMESSDSLVSGYTNLNLMSNSKRSRLISQRLLNWEDNPPGNSAGHCMEIIKQNSPMGCTKSLCVFEGCLSRGFAGLFSTLSYLQFDQERRVSYA
ncbi:hypothetical protein GH714_031975 [Hevea brasiliensis]|uniref:Defective in cullin neddylation protein n=1 Tax=Hevea brasiliensis TaxID=3981 RepID=A0A6A6LHH0_HEVBR|nr:hypothetical protein GH714_031975 [Hevea brasiliensis]